MLTFLLILIVCLLIITGFLFGLLVAYEDWFNLRTDRDRGSHDIP